ncbi:hypothetical protein TNCV_2961391 [Trichonephila clavipes]|nr:hypothetical protein TNCV_2961391 [Trichonephila clavipes]
MVTWWEVFRCLDEFFVTCAFEKDQREPLLGPRQWGANESEDHMQTFVGLPMRNDEGRVVDPSLEFKRVLFRRRREIETKTDFFLELSSSYPRTGGNSQIGETSLFSTVDRAKSTYYSSKANPRILPADFGG